MTSAEKRVLFWAALRDFDRVRHIESVFLYSAAPVLRHAKPAVLINLQPRQLLSWRERQDALQRATGLQTFEIKNRQGSTLLLIYDERALHSHLHADDAQALLALYSYPPHAELPQMLTHLTGRFSDCFFPHEIGVFLGYSTPDVASFIKNSGKNCVYCRHWKVYHNVEHARRIFDKIDAAQDYAIDLLGDSMPIHIAANLLRAAV